MGRALDPVKPGQPVSAAWANEVLAELRRLRRIAAAPPLQLSTSEAGIQISLAQGIPRIDLVELAEDIAADEVDKDADLLVYDRDLSGDRWHDSDRDLNSVCDAQSGLHLAGERKLVLAHASAGKSIVWPAVQFHLGKADAQISAGGSGTVSIWEVSGSSHADSGKDVTAHDWLGQGIGSGLPVAVFQHLQAPRRWYAIGGWASKARHVRFTLDASLATTESSKAATVRSYADGPNPGSSITVHNQPVGTSTTTFVFEGASGATGLAYYDPANDKYWINWVMC